MQAFDESVWWIQPWN